MAAARCGTSRGTSRAVARRRGNLSARLARPDRKARDRQPAQARPRLLSAPAKPPEAPMTYDPPPPGPQSGDQTPGSGQPPGYRPQPSPGYRPPGRPPPFGYQPGWQAPGSQPPP